MASMYPCRRLSSLWPSRLIYIAADCTDTTLSCYYVQVLLCTEITHTDNHHHHLIVFMVKGCLFRTHDDDDSSDLIASFWLSPPSIDRLSIAGVVILDSISRQLKFNQDASIWWNPNLLPYSCSSQLFWDIKPSRIIVTVTDKSRRSRI